MPFKQSIFQSLATTVAIFLCSITFAQSKGVKISGVITDSLQKPVGFATVNLSRLSQPGIAIQTTYTNDAGKFNITKVDSGSYILEVSHTGFADQKHELVVEEGKDVVLPA